MKVLSFGEVLWDIYPNKKVIGGAPLNFSGCFASLGGDSAILSAVGKDALGKETVEAVKSMGVDCSFIGLSDEATGVCNVSIDAYGSPSYDLAYNTAYDNIPVDTECLLSAADGRFDALYFGTLAQRCEKSRETLRLICENGLFREILFDVNFRSDFYNTETVKEGLKRCTVLKFSREEAYVFNELGIITADGCFCSGDQLMTMCRCLSSFYDIPTVLVSLDKDGGIAYDAFSDKFFVSEKPQADVVSTVGGGDCFSASYLYFKMLGENPLSCLNKAVRLSSFVVSSIESVPSFPEELINSVKNKVIC